MALVELTSTYSEKYFPVLINSNKEKDLIHLLTTCILLSLSTVDKNAALEITEMVAYLGTYAVLTYIYILIYICMYADVYLCKKSYIYALNG
jgi:hypothetical protein